MEHILNLLAMKEKIKALDWMIEQERELNLQEVRNKRDSWGHIDTNKQGNNMRATNESNINWMESNYRWNMAGKHFRHHIKVKKRSWQDVDSMTPSPDLSSSAISNDKPDTR